MVSRMMADVRDSGLFMTRSNVACYIVWGQGESRAHGIEIVRVATSAIGVNGKRRHSAGCRTEIGAGPSLPYQNTPVLRPMGWVRPENTPAYDRLAGWKSGRQTESPPHPQSYTFPLGSFRSSQSFITPNTSWLFFSKSMRLPLP